MPQQCGNASALYPCLSNARNALATCCRFKKKKIRTTAERPIRHSSLADHVPTVKHPSGIQIRRQKATIAKYIAGRRVWRFMRDKFGFMGAIQIVFIRPE